MDIQEGYCADMRAHVRCFMAGTVCHHMSPHVAHSEVRHAPEANDSNMANVRDSDTSLWLHNKLGTSNDSWTGSSICSQLNAEVLRNIKDCFPDLQTQVKLKLLLSFFHIPRRNVEEVSVLLFISLYLHTFVEYCFFKIYLFSKIVKLIVNSYL